MASSYGQYFKFNASTAYTDASKQAKEKAQHEAAFSKTDENKDAKLSALEFKNYLGGLTNGKIDSANPYQIQILMSTLGGEVDGIKKEEADKLLAFSDASLGDKDGNVSSEELTTALKNFVPDLTFQSNGNKTGTSPYAQDFFQNLGSYVPPSLSQPQAPKTSLFQSPQALQGAMRRTSFLDKIGVNEMGLLASPTGLSMMLDGLGVSGSKGSPQAGGSLGAASGANMVGMPFNPSLQNGDGTALMLTLLLGMMSNQLQASAPRRFF